jgi:membrane protein implicated in regulation of membrane protease activity
MIQLLKGKGNNSEIDLFNRSKWGTVEEEIKPNTGGRIKYQNSSWPALENNNQTVHQGEVISVLRREGMFQIVERCL